MISSRTRALMCILLLAMGTLPVFAEETCFTASDMDPAVRSSLENTATRYFQFAAAGDYAGLRQNAIPALASNFGGVEAAVGDNRPNLQGASSTVRSVFQLDATGNSPIPRAEFYCGVFNSADRVGLVIPNLSPGRYALAILDVRGGKAPITLSMVLQQFGGAWKLGGFYARPTQIGGHDGNWYLTKAREYKSRGGNHNAWFYYLTAWELLNPVSFMSTPQLDKIVDEMQLVRPSDLPANGSTMDLVASGKTYRVTQMFATQVGDGLDVVVKYQVPSLADRGQAYQDNMALIKAVVARYPELRDAFAGVVARAVTPSGEDYGSLLAMKDVK
jgi:hypothetical protein